MPGVFITRGMTLTIPQIILTESENGKIELQPIVPLVRFDVCPSWIQIANSHLDRALEAEKNRNSAWTSTDENLKAKALENEFEASMQAIMSAAIAWDAFYEILKQYVDISEQTIKTWQQKRTARYKQVLETIRCAFSLKPKATALLRKNLKEIYKYRDLAVHPSGKIQEPILHPELDVGIEWRFVYFRAYNAKVIVSNTGSIIWELANKHQPTHPKIAEYQKTLINRLQEIFPTGPIQSKSN